jgi:hypothetical protein
MQPSPQRPYRSVFVALRVRPDAQLTAAIEAFNARLRQGCHVGTGTYADLHTQPLCAPT